MALKISSNGNGHSEIAAEEETKNGAKVTAKKSGERTTARMNADGKTAMICIVYLLLMLAFFAWLLFDTWIGNYCLARIMRYDLARLDNNGFRLVAFTVIAGGLGGAIDGIRSVIDHLETFNRKHVWKYISVPWMGCTLALLVYALLRSSIAVVGGNVSSDGVGSAQVLANFAAGALAGFESRDVFIWLDDKAHKIFQVKVPENVPNVIGKPQEIAASRLEAAKLELGEVSKVQQKNGKPAGTVMAQSPPPGTPIDRGQSVDITVAAESKAN